MKVLWATLVPLLKIKAILLSPSPTLRVTKLQPRRNEAKKWKGRERRREEGREREREGRKKRGIKRDKKSCFLSSRVCRLR